MIGEPEMSLEEGMIGAVCYNEAMREGLEKFSKEGNKIVSNGTQYVLDIQGIQTITMRIMGSSSVIPIQLVYPDDAVSNFTVHETIVDVCYPEGKEQETETAVWNKQNDLKKNDPKGEERPFSYFTTKYVSQDSDVGLRVTISFVGIYLGITFLVTAAVILALQQLSAANDNRKRYATLRQLGTDEQLLNRSLLKQIKIYFLIPLGVAAIHAAFGISGLMAMIQMVWYENVFQDVFLGMVVIAVIYGLYFAITYFSGKKIIRS
jgi:putative ABC transport system permease protein